MAGESPDKSEQRKSSGETAGSERDPRLAMFREDSPASEASSEPSPPSPAATDQRTAVFRLPPRDGAETAGEGAASSVSAAPAAASDGAAEDGDGSGRDTGEPEPSGTGADSAAGAAEAEDGVADGAGAGAPDAVGASGADAGAREPGSGADAEDGEGPDAAREPDADSGADAEAERDAMADSEADAGADSGVPSGDAADSGADDAGDPSDAEGGPSSGTAAGDERLRAAVAAWVATGDDAADGEPAGTATPQKASPAATGAPETDAEPESVADAEDGADAPDAADDDTSARAETTPGVASGSVNGTVDADEAPEADDETSDAGARAGADADGPGDDTAAAASADAPAPADGTTDTAPSTTDTTDTDGDSDADGDSEGTPAGDGTPAERPAVDQATAVFKALKRPAVDQPTTALKLPKPASDPDPDPAPRTAEAPGKNADTDEAEAERTSTFVPLRRDDARPAAAGAAARPKPAAPAASASASASAATAEPGTSAGASGASLTEAERTRQQPMPPLPPLDLLAELTNTPPPPETPTRTVVRRIKIWTPLVVLLLIVFAVAQSLRPLPDPSLTLTADPEYTFDGGKPSLPWPGEGQGQIVVSGVGVVGQFGDEKPVPIASVTKTMTAYIIMRDHPLKRGEDGEAIPVDALAEKEGGYDKTNDESTLNTIKEGDTISVRDALSAIMIPSANNVARLVARWDAGSEEAFVKKMNDTAKELGMTNTTYTDPSGLDATTVSTAADQVKLGQALVKNKAMVDITRVQEWYDPSGKRHSNYNTLMPRNGAIGIKTGSTTKAGGNLLFAAYKDIGGSTQTIVGAVLSQHEAPILQTVNRVSEEVLVATREALLEKKVVTKGDVVGYVDDGLGGRTPVVATKDLTIVGWTGLKLESDITDGGKKLSHTAKAGTVVGSLTTGTGPGTTSVPVALQQDLVEPGFGDKLTRLG
ncbi:D-alanyl-D-alanine carboxypeptidase [Streptomyces genisteinicus]|uniref:D-alanyl-D-alanine carboxypeptidase n=1 Tax=Streptomyces genisteinicus TaxID=2768068 RepID=UPI001FE64E6B|nr:serine hydrolase [Streptomyces genisteinicus]